MKSLTFLLAGIVLGSIPLSCGESSRDKGHESVVQKERAENDVPVPLEPAPTEREIEIIANDLDFNPNEITVTAGQDLSVSLLNRREQEHNIEFELPSGEKKLPNNVPPEQSDILEFTAPQEAGTYTFYCPVKDHHEKGMEGKLIVQAE